MVITEYGFLTHFECRALFDHCKYFFLFCFTITEAIIFILTELFSLLFQLRKRMQSHVHCKVSHQTMDFTVWLFDTVRNPPGSLLFKITILISFPSKSYTLLRNIFSTRELISKDTFHSLVTVRAATNTRSRSNTTADRCQLRTSITALQDGRGSPGPSWANESATQGAWFDHPGPF